jgi:hypothetical protein
MPFLLPARVHHRAAYHPTTGTTLHLRSTGTSFMSAPSRHQVLKQTKGESNVLANQRVIVCVVQVSPDK